MFHILDSICIECNDFLNNDQCDCINNKSTESSAPHLKANSYASRGSLSTNIMDHVSSEASCLINQTPKSFQSNTLGNKTPNDISTEFRFNSRGIHMGNLNIRHLKPKLDEMKQMLNLSNNNDIFGVCETFLDKTVDNDILSINGYTFERKDRSQCNLLKAEKGGGIVIYITKDLQYERRNNI